MNKTGYNEMFPLSLIKNSDIIKYSKGVPKDAVPFTGYPRMQGSLPAGSAEKEKIILVSDPLGEEPVVLEFMVEDILFVEELPSAVTEKGEGVPMIKIWVRRGAVGMILEPFEVGKKPQAVNKIRAIKERILKTESRVQGTNSAI